MKNYNRVMGADSYKFSHASQYPQNMVSMYDYMEARSSKVYPATVFVGLQGFLKEYFSEPITIQEVNQAYAFAKQHGISFDIDGWEYIVKELQGKLPVEIKAIEEGTLVPVGNVLMTIESTDTKVPWIAGWLETMIMRIWYPTNIATKSYYTRKMLEKYGSPEWAKFAFHSFGSRGSTTTEASEIGGFAHLTQFMGTDNFDSLKYCFDNYNSQMAGYSVFASEHSSTTSWGKDNEMNFVYQMLLDNPDAPIMSFVADSYDVYKFTDEVTKPGSKIRELIESRPNQKFVLRPDSGNPIEVLSKMTKIMEDNGVFDIMIEGPDGIERMASSNFGILWGDGVNPEVIENILKISMTEGKYAAENFVFGSGGDLMQNHTRDTMGFAVKCSSITVEIGEDTGHSYTQDIDVFKDPITDPGKKSKKGKVTTLYNPDTGEYKVTLVGDKYPGFVQALKTVYKDGNILTNTSLDEIRNNAK